MIPLKKVKELEQLKKNAEKYDEAFAIETIQGMEKKLTFISMTREEIEDVPDEIQKFLEKKYPDERTYYGNNFMIFNALMKKFREDGYLIESRIVNIDGMETELYNTVKKPLTALFMNFILDVLGR